MTPKCDPHFFCLKLGVALPRHSTHAIALRSDPPLPRALRRPLTPTEPPQDLGNRLLGTLAVGGSHPTRPGGKTRVVSQGKLADEPMYHPASSSDGTHLSCIYRGMGQNLRRSARATYLENAHGSATHRVLSDGAERWSMSLGHEHACAVVPPPTYSACRGTQCPGWEAGWRDRSPSGR